MDEYPRGHALPRPGQAVLEMDHKRYLYCQLLLHGALPQINHRTLMATDLKELGPDEHEDLPLAGLPQPLLDG